MQDVVDEIYKEYNQNIDEQISKNAFYKYFYNLLETGITYTKFFNRKLIKEIDEEWLKEIEKAMPHLQEVVDKPRTFIEENRQVVNVAKAKKFTPDSVKHLAQHSEMISKVYDNGEVEPNRVLNIYKEESMNTYENRFIYTLLLELRTFINKRTDVIFDNSKNEDGVKLEIDSVIDNYTEIINYKTTLRIQEKQADISNDSENINVFTRISNVHKKINDMASSGFFLEMSNFPVVKYPIVKTNAISKNPHYKACYELWNFIRTYDRIGYKVEMIEQDPNISKSFENDIYNMMLLNYVVTRKQMTIKDIMNIDKPLRENSVGVNMIKSFIREVVNEFGFTESELKNLLLMELVSAEKEKEELLRKKEEIQRKMQGTEEKTVEETANIWEDFTGTSDNKDRDESLAYRKLTKKQISKVKREKKEQERLERLKKLEEEKKRLEELNAERRKLEETEQEEEKAKESNINEVEIAKKDMKDIGKKKKKNGLFGLWKRKE